MISLKDLSPEEQALLMQQAKLEIKQSVGTKSFEDKLATMKKKTLEDNLKRLKGIKCANGTYSLELFKDHVRAICHYYYRSYTHMSTSSPIRLHSEEQYNLYSQICQDVVTALLGVYKDIKSTMPEDKESDEDAPYSVD